MALDVLCLRSAELVLPNRKLFSVSPDSSNGAIQPLLCKTIYAFTIKQVVVVMTIKWACLFARNANLLALLGAGQCANVS